jgi:hypothetical protein
VERAAVVIGGHQVVEVQIGSSLRRDDVSVGGEADDPVWDRRAGDRVVAVEIAIGCESGGRRRCQQALLAGMLTARVRKGVAKERAGGRDDAKGAVLLADEEAASGANSMATGRLRPLTKVASLNPAGERRPGSGSRARAARHESGSGAQDLRRAEHFSWTLLPGS